MSIQRDALNMALRTVVKPFLSAAPMNQSMLAFGRPPLDMLGSMFFRPPADLVISPYRIGNLQAEWLTPKQHHTDRVLLYFHGGGYLACSPKTHRNITGRLSRLGRVRTLAINYRKAPEHPYPAPLEDAISAYRHLLEEGFQADNILFAGDSAGGHLTLCTLIAARDSGLPMPRAAICISPWTDLSMSGASVYTNRNRDPMIPASRVEHAAKHFCGDIHLKDPRVSPLYAELHDLPPLLVHVGDTEILRDDAERLVTKALQLGIDVQYRVWRNMPHVFHAFAGWVPQSNKAINHIADFILQQFGEHPLTMPEKTPIIPMIEGKMDPALR